MSQDPAFVDALATLAEGEPLRGEALTAAFATVMDGQATHEQCLAFLAGMDAQMHDPAAIAAGARAMRARMHPVTPPRGAIDVCGTGGDASHTLNVSTAVAFVVAGCGVPVAKHGNRAMSSRTGAADVLEALGVTLTADRATLERAMQEAGVAFLFAQNHHPAARHVAAARKQYAKRTIFNVLGPMANPANVRGQLMGVFSADLAAPIVEALKALGCERAIVVHGAGGTDEFTFDRNGQNIALMVDKMGTVVPCAPHFWELASTFQVQPFPLSAIAGADAKANAKALRDLLTNDAISSPYETIVLLNAAAALVVAGRFDVSDTQNAWHAATASLRSGAALNALDRLAAITQGSS